MNRVKSGRAEVDQAEWVADDPTWTDDVQTGPPEWLGDLLLCHWTNYNVKPWDLDEAPLVWVSRMQEFMYQVSRQGVRLG